MDELFKKSTLYELLNNKSTAYPYKCPPFTINKRNNSFMISYLDSQYVADIKEEKTRFEMIIYGTKSVLYSDKQVYDTFCKMFNILPFSYNCYVKDVPIHMNPYSQVDSQHINAIYINGKYRVTSCTDDNNFNKCLFIRYHIPDTIDSEIVAIPGEDFLTTSKKVSGKLDKTKYFIVVDIGNNRYILNGVEHSGNWLDFIIDYYWNK